VNLETLLATLPNLTPNDRSLIERAYHKAEQAHEGQARKSGEPYFTHCVAVAHILADMRLDAEAIAAALLHDTLEDTSVTREELQSEFGYTVAMLVDGVSKLTNLPIHMDNGRRNQRELEYIRKMLLAMGDDVRVVLVKLADRLHNMRTLGYMPPHKQQKTAQETLDIFAPLANRLGIWQFKWELEDLSFRYMNPEAYKRIATNIAERRTDREAYMDQIINVLRSEMEKYGVEDATITGRPKHIYSIYRKMQDKKLSFDQIYDVRAVRVIVDNKPECYLVLGLAHNLWRPIPGEFDDYIAAPKDNFYQSLHTAVLDSQGKTVEVQIRTWEMHEHAEYGVAAHWRYKEGHKDRDEDFERRINFLRRLMEFGPEVDNAEAFMDTMKSEVFQDRIYAFTPKGDVYDLPVGSTPIDFAYHIHTEIGNRCRGAKVHGRLVSLDYKLKTGDQVEILTSKRGGPSLDWLNPSLGYTKTARAKGKIRYWFRKLNREKHLANGRELLERELKRLGLLDSMAFDTVAQLFGFEHDKVEEFMVKIGAGDINSSQIANRILEMERQNQKASMLEEMLQPTPRPAPLQVSSSPTNGVNIMGTGGLLVNLARCCSPMPGDAIVGYVTRGRGVTVHRQDCSNIQAQVEPERMVEVTWEHVANEQRYAVPVEIIAYDREGLMRDISTVIADVGVNMSSVNVSTRQNIATFQLTVEIHSVDQLTRILNRLDSVENVVEARRRNMA
jgi:GTP diphosphokinase / guanosine-3',5'-bis(diphosphate) 3'-diphosphatase